MGYTYLLGQAKEGSIAEDARIVMTGGASRRPRLVGGVRARNHVWFFPCREAPPCGRGASLYVSIFFLLLYFFPLDPDITAGTISGVIFGYLLLGAMDRHPFIGASQLVFCTISPFLYVHDVLSS